MAKPFPICSGRFSPGPGPAIMVHGGAWDIPASETHSHLEGMRHAVETAVRLLGEGADALDVVVAAVASMEDSGIFDAGRGSVLTRQGIVEMDAGVMRGEDLAFGSVAAVRTVANPIRAARSLLDAGRGEVRLMVGPEADRFAAAAGLRADTPDLLRHPREVARWEEIRKRDDYHSSWSFVRDAAPTGTVGCVVRDARGRTAAATSTGGTPFRPEGRVGDSPLPGSGFYADKPGAASATGWGEAIAASGLCGRSVAALEAGRAPEEVVRAELTRMHVRIRNNEGQPAAGGIILLSAHGEAAWGYSTPRMARAGWSPERGAWALLDPA